MQIRENDRMLIRKTILLVGAGQLGSRYLQGLAKCRTPLKIYVHDIHAESLILAEQRLLEVLDSESNHEVIFTLVLDSVDQAVDLAIVATTADVRPKVLAAICKYSKVRYWILEKVLAQSESALNEIQAYIGVNCKAWVNTPRRIMPWHQQIKDQLGLSQPITLKVEGADWGLACNSVHFLDLLAWWTGETLRVIYTDNLDATWFEGKRSGNWEIGGTLIAKFSGGSSAILTVNSDFSISSMSVSDESLSWRIDEPKGIARRSDGLTIAGRLPFQSEMSAGLVDAIITTGFCELPTLNESIDLHRVFIRSMQAHWQRAGHPEATLVPIT